MNLTIPAADAPQLVIVSLSRSNLTGLLAQLDDNASDAQLMRVTDAGRLIVTAQEDDAHYGDRTPGRSQ